MSWVIRADAKAIPTEEDLPVYIAYLTTRSSDEQRPGLYGLCPKDETHTVDNPVGIPLFRGFNAPYVRRFYNFTLQEVSMTPEQAFSIINHPHMQAGGYRELLESMNPIRGESKYYEVPDGQLDEE